MNQANYRMMIRNFDLFVLRAQDRKRSNLIKIKTQWLQQDGAPPHTARETRLFLKRHFEGRFISLCCTVKWPHYSPDLTSPDFFYGGISRTGFMEILGLVLLIK